MILKKEELLEMTKKGEKNVITCNFYFVYFKISQDFLRTNLRPCSRKAKIDELHRLYTVCPTKHDSCQIGFKCLLPYVILDIKDFLHVISLKPSFSQIILL